jgi:hypothetical protein
MPPLIELIDSKHLVGAPVTVQQLVITELLSIVLMPYLVKKNLILIPQLIGYGNAFRAS